MSINSALDFFKRQDSKTASPIKRANSNKEDQVLEEFYNIDSKRQEYLKDIENLNKLKELHDSDKGSFSDDMGGQLDFLKQQRMELYKREEVLFTDLEGFAKLVKYRKIYLSQPTSGLKPTNVPEKLTDTLKEQQGIVEAKLSGIKIEREKYEQSFNNIKNKLSKTDSLIAGLASNLFTPRNNDISNVSSNSFEENLNNRSQASVKNLYLRKAEKLHKNISKYMYHEDAETDNLIG